jgi:hypothetical protein
LGLLEAAVAFAATATLSLPAATFFTADFFPFGADDLPDEEMFRVRPFASTDVAFFCATSGLQRTGQNRCKSLRQKNSE